MRSISSVRVLAALALALGLAACGGGSDGDDDDTGRADASTDAAGGGAADAAPDAPPAGGALGQICNMNTPCPSSAMLCLGSASGGFCSLTCAPGQMNMPNAQGQFPVPPAPAAHATCAAAMQAGAPGTGACAVILSNTLTPPVPMGQMPQAGTTYTYDVACIVQCSATMTCPTGLTCRSGACTP